MHMPVGRPAKQQSVSTAQHRREAMLRAVETLAAGTVDRVERHYVIERELADRLRHSTPDERLHLYQDVYDLLFQQVPDHPLVTPDIEERERVVATQTAFLSQLMPAGGVFMEVGSGDGRLSIAMASHAGTVHAVDVSTEISKCAIFPANCRFVLSTGCRIPVEPNSVHLAFSDQLMEHLHPDDAVVQLREIYAALAPQGIYLAFTPNRLSGPHDVSKFFDDDARGFHLKEYTTWELRQLLQTVGFRKVYVPMQIRGRARLVPSGPVAAIERAIGWTPRRVRRSLTLHRPMKRFLGRIAAVK